MTWLTNKSTCMAIVDSIAPSKLKALNKILKVGAVKITDPSLDNAEKQNVCEKEINIWIYLLYQQPIKICKIWCYSNMIAKTVLTPGTHPKWLILSFLLLWLFLQTHLLKNLQYFSHFSGPSQQSSTSDVPQCQLLQITSNPPLC